MKTIATAILTVWGTLCPILCAQSEPGLLTNTSTRALAGNGEESAITGFVIVGGPKNVLVRGIGPSLSKFGVARYAAHPAIVVHDAGGNIVGTGKTIASMSEGYEKPGIFQIMHRCGAFELPWDAEDAVAYLRLEPGAYTVVTESSDGVAGIVLTEVYLDPGVAQEN